MSEDPSSLIQENQTNGSPFGRRERPARACRLKSAARLHAAAVAEAEEAASVRRRKSGHRKERVVREEEPEREPTPPPEPQCKIITQLVGDPPPSQGPRWELRSMWELASVLNFLNVFRQFLNVKVEFSVEELETALITPNQTLADLHIPLLKAIPPIARMALGRNTWITVLCRKLKHWWYWVAEGDLPIIASHGTEFEAYNALDPRVRVIILKAICDIRVEQEDIRNYIDDSIKGGIRLSTFRKERIGGDSYGISYWYEDDPIIGHRLYREIRKMDVKKAKGKNAQPLPSSCYQWETVATNLDDFVDVAEKLLASKNRTEASVGKKLKNDMLPEIEAVHKKREKLLKKQQREALYLDNVVHMDGFGPGRSLRGRKPVTYTFDDFDRSINEAIKINKNTPPSPNSIIGGEKAAETDTGTEAYMMNGHVNSPPQNPQGASFDSPSPMSSDYEELEEENKDEVIDYSNRRRRRSQRYSTTDYVDAISDNDEATTDHDDAGSDFEDDIVGEAVYDDEYMKKQKKKRKVSSGSEGEEEYNWDDENLDEEEEEDDDDNSLSMSDDSDEPRKRRKLRGRPSKKVKSKSVDDGLRRSRRATRNRINYKQYEISDSEDEAENENAIEYNDQTDSEHEDFSEESQNPEAENREIVEKPVEEIPEMTIEEKTVQNNPPEKSNSSSQDDLQGVRKRRFLDLNELAPDGQDTEMKDEDTDDF